MKPKSRLLMARDVTEAKKQDEHPVPKGIECENLTA